MLEGGLPECFVNRRPILTGRGVNFARRLTACGSVQGQEGVRSEFSLVSGPLPGASERCAGLEIKFGLERFGRLHQGEEDLNANAKASSGMIYHSSAALYKPAIRPLPDGTLPPQHVRLDIGLNVPYGGPSPQIPAFLVCADARAST
jgi:hypothetical protein